MNSIFKLLDPYRWIIGGVLIASLVAAFFFYRASLIRDGIAQCKADQQEELNTALIERNREIARLITINQGIQDELNAVEVAASDLARDRARALSLRDKAQRSAAIANATTAALRDHATRAEDDLDRSDADTERFGLEAVRASAVAHALNATLQARRPLTTPAMPASPFNRKDTQ